MAQVRRPLIAALVLFTGAITLDRIGVTAGENVIATSAYAVALLAVVLPLVSPALRRISVAATVLAAIATHAAWSLASGNGMLGSAGVHLAVTEIVFVGLAAWIGRHLAGAVARIDDAIASTASGETPAIDLEGPTAANEIQTELARSRRHDRPMSVTVLGPTDSGLEAALQRASLELDRAVRLRFLFGSLARTVAQQLRRSDLLFEHRPTGRLIVLSPETDDAGTSLLLRRILDATARAGIEIRAGSATFPDDGIGFETLVEHAEAELAATTEPLRIVAGGHSA